MIALLLIDCTLSEKPLITVSESHTRRCKGGRITLISDSGITLSCVVIIDISLISLWVSRSCLISWSMLENSAVKTVMLSVKHSSALNVSWRLLVKSSCIPLYLREQTHFQSRANRIAWLYLPIERSYYSYSVKRSELLLFSNRMLPWLISYGSLLPGNAWCPLLPRLIENETSQRRKLTSQFPRVKMNLSLSVIARNQMQRLPLSRGTRMLSMTDCCSPRSLS